MQCRIVSLLTLFVVAAPANRLLAQGEAGAPAPTSCTADWACADEVRTPLGFAVREVEDGGRYVTLEDGTVWEILLQDRATVAGWQPQDFVAIRSIAAPIQQYEWMLSKTDNVEWHAAAKLVGRRAPAYQESGPAPEDDTVEQ